MKVVKTILFLLVGLASGLLAALIYRMYTPVLNVSQKIESINDYAMHIEDELIPRDVKIIGLGEATHGNKEFQQLKQDVLKTLIRDNGVSAVCFEMDYAEGVLINDYVVGATDMSIEELFSHISFDLYHTAEMQNLIEWVKEYNAESRDGQLEFYGFDIQNPESDVYVIDAFLREHAVLPEQRGVLQAFLNGDFSFHQAETSGLLDALKLYKEELSDKKYENIRNRDRILQCIDTVFKAKELSCLYQGDGKEYGTYRDRTMAEIILGIYDTVGYPIMITGHNGHVGYAGSYVKTAGAYLKEALRDDYFVIGTDYFKTTASIKSGNGRKNHFSYSADPLSYQAKELGTYYLRFSDIEDNTLLYYMVNSKMATGSLGEGFSLLNYLLPASVRVYAPPTDLYNAMIFVYEATPFTHLPY